MPSIEQKLANLSDISQDLIDDIRSLKQREVQLNKELISALFCIADIKEVARNYDSNPFFDAADAMNSVGMALDRFAEKQKSQ
jgi:hypothetical protein